MVERTYRLLNATLAKQAKKSLRGGLCGLCAQLAVVAPLHAAPPARTMYAEALAREQTVRVALAADDAAPAMLADVRAVVAAYEAVVAHHPSSGYSDNALWQAGRLALDAFARFGQRRDKDAGARLLRRLVAAYPASRLVAQVPEQLTRAGELAAPVGPEPAPPSHATLVTIKNIRRAALPDAVRITIELDTEVPFHEERIPDPARVFVDLPGTRAAPALADHTMRFESDADIVRQVRIGRHPNNITRIVLDAAGVASYSVYPLYNPYRLVIDCVRATIAAATPAPGALADVQREPTPAPLVARRLTTAWQRRLPAMHSRAATLLANAYSSAAGAAPVVRQHADSATAAAEPAPIADLAPIAPLTPVAPPAKNIAGGFSIARQLGLGVSRIVVDAGHGGHDPGAQGKGVTEAELVLDVALRLEMLLQKVPGVEVILTRRTDEFIPLQERTAMANREGADLFLSIHANASPNAAARGIETYFLNFANNLSAAAVAARENAASGQVMGALPDFVKAIALNNKLDESRDFATQVQRSMIERLKTTNKTIKSLGVKQAPFVVLIGAAMPSVLAEISFVTNPQEARLLKGTAYRQRIAESLLNAVRKYQTSLKAATAVAHQ